MERVTVGQTVSVSLNIRLGLSVKHLIDEYKSSNVIENIVSSFDPHERFIIAESKKYLGVYLHFDTRPQDVLKAYFFGVSYLQDRNQIKEKYWDIQGKWQEFLNLAQKEGRSQIFLRKLRCYLSNVLILHLSRLASQSAFIAGR